MLSARPALRSTLQALATRHPRTRFFPAPSGRAHPDPGAGAAARRLTTVHKEWEKEHLSGPQRGAAMPDNVPLRQRRIIHRSKQRGWLELDILFGGWAAKHVPHMTDDAALGEVERLLDADTPDVLKWVLRQQTPPPKHDNPTMRSMQAFAAGDGHINER